jgi:hypothetical protein
LDSSIAVHPGSWAVVGGILWINSRLCVPHWQASEPKPKRLPY